MLLIAVVAGKVSAAMRKGLSTWTAQAACLGAVCAGGLHSLLDFSLEIQANTLLFLAIFAAGLAASANVKRS